MTDMDALREKWMNATANAPYGVQRVFVDVLTLVAEEKKKDLVWGMDYGDGVCLVNAAGNMLTTSGGHGIPMAHFGPIVSLYDNINREFRARDINTDNYVSPLAAEILLQWFAPLKPTPLETAVNDVMANESFAEGLSYVEPTDEEMTRALMNMLSEAPPAVESSDSTVESMVDEPSE